MEAIKVVVIVAVFLAVAWVLFAALLPLLALMGAVLWAVITAPFG